MSELAIVVIALFAVSVVIWAVSEVYNRKVAMASPQWQIQERTAQYANGTWISVWLERHPHGDRVEKIRIGEIPCADPDFEDKLLELRIRAEDKATILNRGLNP